MKITQETFRAPISAEHPCGVNVRTAGRANHLYHEGKDARHQARLMERSRLSDPTQPEPTAQWQQVKDLCEKILCEESKDLEVCAWLIEANTRLQGFQGLSEGFQLVADLLNTYWDELHPAINPEDPEERFATLGGLNGFGQAGSLIQPLTQLPLCQGETTTYAFWQYSKASDVSVQNDSKQRDATFAELGFNLSDIEEAFRAQGKNHAQALQKSIQEAITAFTNYKQSLEPADSLSAPPTSTIDEALNHCQTQVYYLMVACDFLEAEVDEAIDEITHKESPAASEQATPKTTDRIQSRNQALQQIAAIADFFAATEPHSPIAYLLKRAVYWGSLSLPELLTELIDDQGALHSVCGLTGIELQEKQHV